MKSTALFVVVLVPLLEKSILHVCVKMCVFFPITAACLKTVYSHGVENGSISIILVF